MYYVRRTLLTLFWGLLGLYALLYIFVNLPPSKHWIVQTAESILSEKVGAKVEIGSFAFELFDRASLHDICLYTPQGDTLFTAKRVGLNIDIFPLFRNELVIQAAYLASFDAHLRIDSTGQNNFKFLIDAFASRDTIKKPLPFDLIKLQTLVIRRGSARLIDERNNNYLLPLHISELALNTSLNQLSKDSIDASIDRLSFIESRGFKLNKLSAQFQSNSQKASLHHVRLTLPSSLIHISDCSLNYSQVDSSTRFWDKSTMNLVLEPSYIANEDIKSLLPAQISIPEKIQLALKAEGTLSNLNLNYFHLSAGEDLDLSLHGSAINLQQPEQTYIQATLDNGSFVNSSLINTYLHPLLKDQTTAKQIYQLLKNSGKLKLNANIEGTPTDLQGSLKLNAPWINMAINGSMRQKNEHYKEIKADLRITDLIPSILSSEWGVVQQVNIISHSQVSIYKNKFADFQTRTEINNLYTRKAQLPDLLIDAHFSAKQGFRVSLNQSSILQAEFNLRTDDPTKPTGDLSIAIDRFPVSNIGLNQVERIEALSLSLAGEFEGKSEKNFVARFELDDLIIKGIKQTLAVDFIHFNTGINDQGNRSISIVSPYLSFNLDGEFNPESLISGVNLVLSNYLPALAPPVLAANLPQNRFSFQLLINGMDELSSMLDLPFTVDNQTALSGHFDSYSRQIEIELQSPQVEVNGTKISDAKLSINNMSPLVAQLNLSAGILLQSGNKAQVSLRSLATNNSLTNEVSWDVPTKVSTKGNLSINAFLSRNEESQLQTILRINPTSIAINDTLWQIGKSSALIRPSYYRINHFAIERPDQYLRINGVVSPNETDTVRANLRDISLDYIFALINIPAFYMGGKATGNLEFSSLLSNPKGSVPTLHVQKLTINGYPVGNLQAQSRWDHEHKGILLKGTIADSLNRQTTVNGGFYLNRDSMSLVFNADQLNLKFLRYYIGSIFRDFEAEASGKVRLFGKFSQGVTVEGAVKVNSMAFGIDYLNTRYSLSDSLWMKHNHLYLRNCLLRDKKNGVAVIDVDYYHQNFQKNEFEVKAQTNNLQILNTSYVSNPTFWGAVYGTGTASLVGNDKAIDINVGMRTDANSKFTFALSDTKNATEYNFIKFVNLSEKHHPDSTYHVTTSNIETPKSSTNINLSLNVDVTRDAQLTLLMDPKTNDMLRATGTGNISLQIPAVGEVEMFGRYTVDNGSYNFNFQNVVNKTFSIRQGGTVTLNGDPLKAEMNVQAVYQTSASLLDLDRSFSDVSRPTVPVQTILGLQGTLSQLALSFDINLPSNTDDITRRVKNLIGTDDMMNRQVIYLIGLGRFYSLSSASTDVGSSGELTSMVASSTVSAQLNNIMRQMTDNWNIGTNFRLDNQGNFQDFEVALSSQINDRLRFNGNFGYREDSRNRSNSFIGDFDFEYQLNKSGTLSGKVYNRTNEKNYYVKTSLTTQGIGLVYRKQFNSFKELFREFVKPKKKETPQTPHPAK